MSYLETNINYYSIYKYHVYFWVSFLGFYLRWAPTVEIDAMVRITSIYHGWFRVLFSR